jgi:hypothetical protein
MSLLFDDISRAIASPVSRRKMLGTVGGMLGGALLAAFGLQSAAMGQKAEKTCATGKYLCNGNCCVEGTPCCGPHCCTSTSAVCLNGACCESGIVCGSTCCESTKAVCLNGACCGSGIVCAGKCCGTEEICVNGKCKKSSSNTVP